MARKKAPDKLTRDSNAAIAAGLSYGKYMANKKSEAHKEEPKQKKKVVRVAVCDFCGCEFEEYDHRNRKYCCEEHRLCRDNRVNWQKRKEAAALM